MSDQKTPDHAHMHLSLDLVIDTKGEDHDYLAQRLNSVLANSIHTSITTLAGENGFDVKHQDASLCLLTPEAASIDEETLTTWLAHQIEGGHIPLEDVARQMARYALEDPGRLREELSERMQISLDDAEPVMQEASGA
ncbi:hypothetical protein KBW71_00565 [Hydrogenophaga aromaticivorans]|uniref:hypothetical protein n=1 Tax=Hydrogenophaga aromaticivorans TaxID=2610898 RepID=UPI001B37584E|nr:hypothetical protein [Hydrogenophaga aromaticivorans]MBQ0916943.1 hypothetical protein [Hydrogenophaga aromaticivorans]MBU4337903.1 hypothetical protein [Actinomycetota bacterium]